MVTGMKRRLHSMRAGTAWAQVALLALSVGFISGTQAQSMARAERMALLGQIPEETLIIFAPEETRQRVTVFTDIACGYCRKLHREVEKLNGLGIEVRYAAFPLRPERSYGKMVSVWCAKDRRKAMTDAKNGRSVPRARCDHPVDEHRDIGKRMGVKATPSLVTDDGRLIRGYRPYRKLARKISEG